MEAILGEERDMLTVERVILGLFPKPYYVKIELCEEQVNNI